MSTYERLDDNVAETPKNHDDTVIPIAVDSETPKKRTSCGKTGMAFCGGGLSGFMIAVVVCSVVFGVVGFAYIKYGPGANGGSDSGPVGKGQVKEGSTGKIFDTKVYDDDTEYSLLGVGRREKKIGPVKINVYAVGFYLHTERGQAALLPFKDSSPDQLRADNKFYDVIRNANIPRHIRIIMSTNIVNKGKMQEGLREALVPAIKNHVDPEKDGDPDEVANAKANILANLFDSDPKDNHVFDFTCEADGTMHALMNKKEKEPLKEPLICAGFTDVFVGANSVAPSLKEDVAGRLNIIFDEGDNNDIQEPSTEVKFKEFLKMTPTGASEPEELRITGTAGMTFLPNPISPAKKDLAFAVYSNWREAQSQLTKYIDSQEPVGNVPAFRDDLLGGHWNRAVVIRLVATDFTVKELKKPYMEAFKASQKARDVSEENMNKANEDVSKVMDQLAESDKIPGGASYTFFCDAKGALKTIFAGVSEEAIKNDIAFADPNSCSAALDAWAGSKTILAKLRRLRSINWDNLGSEIVWDQEVMTAAGINFLLLHQMSNNEFVQFIGGAKQVRGWTLTSRPAPSVLALYVSTNAPKGEIKDMQSVKPEMLNEPENLKRILFGKFGRSLEFVQLDTGLRERRPETEELINGDVVKQLLNKSGNDESEAKADLEKLKALKTKEKFQRLRIECDENNLMTAINLNKENVEEARVSSKAPSLCKNLMVANIAEHPRFTEGSIPDPNVFYGLWTAD